MRTFILLLLMQLVSLPFSYARQPEHSTYLVAHDLKSLDYVRQIDYAQFDYIYLMAAPNWKEYDFSNSGEEIIRDLVTNHAFGKDQGVDVIRELIAQARACQTKVLLSFAGEGFRERVEDPALRAKFVDFMVAFIDKYDFDGIESHTSAARSLREGYPGKTECAGKPEEPENVSYYGSSLLAALFQRTCRKGFPVTRLDQYHDLRHGRRNLGQCTYPQHSSGPDHYRSESLGNV